jgi:hypothetical protein
MGAINVVEAGVAAAHELSSLQVNSDSRLSVVGFQVSDLIER